MPQKLLFGFIGCGKMAEFHADVVRHLGHEILLVVARENSTHIDGFAQKYNIPLKFRGMSSFLKSKDKEKLDAIIICVSWDTNETILKDVLNLGVPILVEKPAVLSLKALRDIRKNKKALKNICVAYNRRHYEFIPHLQTMIKNQKILCADVLFPDPYSLALKLYGPKIKNHILHYSSSHAIDLMYYLLGDVKINSVCAVNAGGTRSFVVDLYSKTYKCPVQFKILMDSAQNSYLKIFFENEVAVLCPFEKMFVYDRIEKQINKDGLNVYLPGIKEEFAVDNRFKPGLFNQMNHFINTFVLKKNTSLVEIKRLEQVTGFCDRMLKTKGN